ncbi:uncharacterized protein [Ptychodera flava]|uniref:uncharacterized protein n=1 Tax=Ptychodera flava TaxID=63121 RepID=UPI00396AB068
MPKAVRYGCTSNRKICPNCKKNMAVRTFYDHKRKFLRGSSWFCRATETYRNDDTDSDNDSIVNMEHKFIHKRQEQEDLATSNTACSEDSSDDSSLDDSDDEVIRNKPTASTHTVNSQDYTETSACTGDSELSTDDNSTCSEDTLYSSSDESSTWSSSDVDSSSEDDECSADCDDNFENFDPRDFIDFSKYSSDHHKSKPESRKSRCAQILVWLLYFLLTWQVTNYVSNNAMEKLLNFLGMWIKCITEEYPAMLPIYSGFPASLFLMRQYLGMNRDEFVKFAVCPKCLKLYSFDDCVIRNQNSTVVKKCDTVIHKTRRQTKICGTKLAKDVVLSNGVRKYKPYKVYCYNSIIDTLEKFLLRPNFQSDCSKWKERCVPDGHMSDIYDGKVWKEFKSKEGSSFWESPCNFGLMLNCDWFQPYERRCNFSVGILYMVVMNLPREIRFKKENIVVVGIIPALDKEPDTLKPFLEPLVKELQLLWKGVKLKTYRQPDIGELCKGALLCCTSDLPANRKLCGFVGHSATHGCSKCFKEFPSVLTGSKDKRGRPKRKLDYSGFARNAWVPRSGHLHRRHAALINQAKSKAKRKQLERKYGVKDTPLLKLEYFNSVQFCVIDPMHNLFTGTAKKVFTTWVDKNLLTSKELNKMEERIEMINATSDLGRLPTKIASNYGKFTADEWKNWTLVYSMFVLKGVLPEVHLQCWQTFVLACRYLCRTCISEADIKRADFLMIKFCHNFEKLYGELSVTPNMHIHGHLLECVKDYGPVYGFWCFSFERCNGAIGDIKTNKVSIETQFMRTIMTQVFAHELQFKLPLLYRDELLPLCMDKPCTTSLDETLPSPSLIQHLVTFSVESLTSVLNHKVWSDNSCIKTKKQYHLSWLDQSERSMLHHMYQTVYSSANLSYSCVSQTYKKYSTIHLGQELYGSALNKRTLRYSYVMATWAGENCTILLDKKFVRPGKVKYYMTHCVQVGRELLEHVIAVVEWFKPMENNFEYSHPLSVWNGVEVEKPGPATYIPVQRICSKFVAVREKSKNNTILVASPLNRKVYH